MVSGPIRWLALLVLCLAAPANALPVQQKEVATARYTSRKIEIDGRGSEWRQSPALVLNKAEQLVDTGMIGWTGPDDASAELRIAYDESHLYLFARIRDQDPVEPKNADNLVSGDVLELFFDTDPSDDLAGERRFNSDDLQLVIVLRGVQRDWAAVILDPDEPPSAHKLAYVDRGFGGIRVAKRPQGKDLFVEAAIPLHNLPGLEPGTRAIGFNAALGDRDPDQKVYNYLVWAGSQPPFDKTGNFGQLRFVGPPILVPRERSSGHFARAVLEWLLYLAPAALVLFLLWVVRRVFLGRLQNRPRVRRAIGFGALGAIVFAIFGPDLIVNARERLEWTEAERLASRVEQLLPRMQSGGLARLKGPSSDQPLVELLAGRPVRVPVEYRYDALSSLAPELLGYQVQRYPEEGFSVYRYGIPLAQQPVAFGLPDVERGDSLAILISEALDPDFGVPDPPHLQMTVETRDGPATQQLYFDTEVASWTGAAHRVALWTEVSLAPGVDRISLEVISGRELDLEGVSVLRSGAPERPQFLGRVSQSGVPTGLRGPYPRAVGHTVAAGQNLRLELPEPRPGVRKVWLFVEAIDGPEFQAKPDGSQVGQILVGVGRGEPISFPLRHQIEVFTSEKDRNPELQRLGRPGNASVAYEWQDREARSKIQPALELDLGARRTVKSISVVNLGNYDLRLREVVLATPKSGGAAPPEGSPLVPTGRLGESRLDASRVAELSAGRFFVFRGGKLSASSAKHVPAELKLPAEVARQLKTEDSARGTNQLQPHAFEAFRRLSSPGYEDTVLGVAVVDAGLASFDRGLRIFGLVLIGLCLPWLLVYLAQTLAPAGSFRLQLTGMVAISTIVPLLLLSLFLINLLERDQRESDRTRLLKGLELAEQRLAGERESLAKQAQSLLDPLIVELRSLLRDETTTAEGLSAQVREALSLARPEDWAEDSFLAISLPHPEQPGQNLRVYDRERSRQLGGATVGLGSAIYSAWGELFVGARADGVVEPGQEVSLILGRVIDNEWLASMASLGQLAVFDLKGYPFAIGGSGDDEELVEANEGPAEQATKVSVIQRLREVQGPLFQPFEIDDQEWLGAFSLLRARDGTPLALLGGLEQPNEAALPLFFGQVGVRRFFLATVGLLLVLVSFFAWMLTDRISRPVEKLEKLAGSLSRGDLAVEVEPVTGSDEVASLNRAFAHMAVQLKQRIEQLDRMNHAMTRLTARLEVEHVAGEALAILREASEALAVMLLVWNRDTGVVRCYGEPGGPRDMSPHGEFVHEVMKARGPFSIPLPLAGSEGGFPLLADRDYCTVFPLRSQERRWGAVVLTYDNGRKPALDLEHFGGLLGQVVSAMETARLYGLAIEDATTGLAVHRYFRRRLAQEVDRCQRSGERMALVRVQVANPADLRARFGDEWFDRLLRRFGDELRSEVEPHALAGRVGLAAFEIMLPHRDGDQASRVARRLRSTLAGVMSHMTRGRSGTTLESAAVAFPDDGHSAEFIADALRRKLRAGEPETATRDAPMVVRRGAVVFASRAMRSLLDTLDRAAASDLSLLIEGDTGVGKEVIVDLCHLQSSRRDAPLVKINCAAIPPALLESELFGHEKGAFTGAVDRKKGHFEIASGGTLFLDEIAEMPIELQAKLLRVLQAGEFVRVGGEHPVRVDVRVIAATHRNLRRRIDAGAFRQDLFFRLQGLRLRIPPLRERKEEIPVLVEQFRTEFGPQAWPVSPSALDALYRHSWPGNVRELRNVIQRALVLSEGPRIEPEDLDLGPEPTSVDDPRTPVDDPRTPAGQRPSGRREPEPTVVIPRPQVPETPDVESRWRKVEAHLEAMRGRGQTPILTPRAYCALVGVSRRTATRDLRSWVEGGRLVSRGHNRGRHYVRPDQPA